MLSFFRRGGTGQAVVMAVVGLVIVVFVLEFRAGRTVARGNVKTDCAVEVGGDCISTKEFWAAYGMVIPQYAEKEQLKRYQLVRRVIDGLIERDLLLREADRLGISVGDEVVEKQLSQGVARVSLPVAEAPMLGYMLGLCQRAPMERACIPGTEGVRLLRVKNSKTGQFEYKIYEREVRNVTNRSPREFKEMQRREATATRMRDLIRARVPLSEAEAFIQYEQLRSTASAEVVAVSRDWFARYVIDASDDAVATWALGHKDRIDEAWKSAKAEWTSGCRLVSAIEVAFDASTGDEDKVALRDKIEKAKQAVKDGMPFEQAVRQYGDASGAARDSSPHCLADSAPQELRQTVESLPTDGVSPIIETSEGFELVKSHGILDEKSLEETGRRAVTRRLFIQAQAGELAAGFGRDLAAQVRAGTPLASATTALARAALGLKGERGEPAVPGLDDPGRPKPESVGPFNVHSNPIPNAMLGQTPAARAFTMKPGEIEVFTTGDGVAVMQLSSVDRVTRASFDTEKAMIMPRLRYAKAHEALTEYVARLRKKAQAGIKISEGLLAMDKKTQESQ
ncbi:MAG: SurA N-terminal domain-containing protein [Polyangiaceae bacterium]|nr:SurA N-terminal domain-containing protein [Polyangiaceae bacterium]